MHLLLQNSLFVHALAIIAGIAFGSVGLVSSIILRQGIPAEVLLLWRFIIVITILFPFAVRTGDFKLHTKNMLLTLLVGVSSRASGMFLYLLAVMKIGVSIATPIYFLYPIFVAIISWVTKEEKFNIPTLFSLILAVSGMLMLSHKFDGASNNGIMLALASAFMIAITMGPREENYSFFKRV